MFAKLSATDSSMIGEARRVATRLAQELGFDEGERGTVALVVTEMAANLVRHAKDGVIFLRGLGGSCGGLEVLTIDHGPGIPDVWRALEDGYSTAGTPGKGLGAIRRLSTNFDIFSQPGVGTVACAQLCTRPSQAALRIGVVSEPHPGETVCGDAWVVVEGRGRALLAVADGLGHGPQAAEAANLAMQVCREHAGQPPHDIMEACDRALRGSRGAALAVVELNENTRSLCYCGVGNIGGLVFDDGSHGFANQNGIVGRFDRRAIEHTYAWPPGSVVVLWSDGLVSRVSLASYPGLAARHPSLVAGTLFRDFARGRDDATVVCVNQAVRR